MFAHPPSARCFDESKNIAFDMGVGGGPYGIENLDSRSVQNNLGRWALKINHSGSAMFYKFNYSFCVIGNYFSCSFTLTNHINLKTSFYTLTELKPKGNLVVQTTETC